MANADGAAQGPTAPVVHPVTFLPVFVPDFNEKDHVYRHPESKVVLPSVTQVMSAVGIIDNEWSSEVAMVRGDRVHRATALLDQGQALDWNVIANIEEYLGVPIAPYIHAWEKFKAESKCEILDIEQRRYHPRLMFAGTRDRRLRWNGKIFKCDIKTVGTPGMPGPSWAQEQLSAYDLLEPGDKSNPDKLASIVLYSDGKYNPEFHNDFNGANYFLSYLTTYRRLQIHGRLKP